MAKPSPQQIYISQRQVARKLALMALYQWHLNPEPFAELYTQYQMDESMAAELRKADGDYFRLLTETAMQESAALDELISPYLDRPLEQVGPIEHSALLLGTLELRDQPEVTFKTVVNEWVNLSKKFGPEQSHKFINGVLDKLGKQLRPDTPAG